MKNNRIISISVVALAIGITGILAFNGNNNVSKATTECSYHNGYHYSAKEATFDEAGHKEFWSCCTCHHSYVDHAPNGSFIDQEDLLMDGSVTEEHIAYLPQLEKTIGKLINDGRDFESPKKHIGSLKIYEGSLKKGDYVYFYINNEEPIKVKVEKTISNKSEVNYIDSETAFPFIEFSNCPSLSGLSNLVYFTNFKDDAINSVAGRYCYRDYSTNLGNDFENPIVMSAQFSNDTYNIFDELAFYVEIGFYGECTLNSVGNCLIFFEGEFYYPSYLFECFKYYYLDGICVCLTSFDE